MPNYTLKTCTDICPWTPLKHRKDAASIRRKEILKFTSSMCTWTYKYLLGNIEGGVIKGKHKFVWMYFLNYNYCIHVTPIQMMPNSSAVAPTCTVVLFYLIENCWSILSLKLSILSYSFWKKILWIHSISSIIMMLNHLKCGNTSTYR